METLTAADGSSVLCFTSVPPPGIECSYETSDDLVHWQTVASVHGLGQTFSVPLRTTALAPPPDPLAPPVESTPEIRNASLLIVPSSSPAGGTVISWTSLENSAPITIRLATPMDPAWPSVPLYWQTFPGFNLFVLHPPVALPAPSENPALTGADAELMAVLEEHFDEMNAEVAANTAATHQTPAPVTTEPSDRLFIRCRARQVDTDFDGVTDDVEFKLLLASGGNPLANPYLADVDGNGVPDGNQIDSDNDGIADALDWAPSDSSLAIGKADPPRYALFETTGHGSPLQISDRGTVLFNTGTWTGGNFLPLPGAGEAWPVAINDHGQILGSEWRDLTNGEHTASLLAACYWASPAAPKQSVQSTTNPTQYADGYGFSWYGLPTLSNTGRFSSWTWQFDEDGVLTTTSATPRLNTWSIPSGNGGQCTPSSRPANAPSVTITYAVDDGLMWGYENLGEDSSAGVVYAPGKLPHLEYPPHNVVHITTAGQTRILALSDGYQAHLSSGGGWTRSDLYQPAIDAAGDGTAIARDHSGIHTPILLNGEWRPLERLAPDLPAKWRDGTVELRDTTPKGWILAQRGPFDFSSTNGDANLETGILLPLRIKGVPPDPAFAHATGVDEFSVGSTDPAADPKLWIMAPGGERTTTLTLQAPLPAQDPPTLRLFNSHLYFDGNSPHKEITAPFTTFSLTASYAVPFGESHPLDISLGGGASYSDPIGVKFMKARTVRVALHKVTQLTPDHPPNPPDLILDPAALGTYLTAVYRPQINATFTVFQGNDIGVDWDRINRSGSLDTSGELGIISEAASGDGSPHIHVFLIGAGKMIQHGAAAGYSDGNSCWIMGDYLDGYVPHNLHNTVAHEVGHILTGTGHPDQGNHTVKLPGTDHSQRMMATIGVRRGCRLVKDEWDMAEVWMKINVDDKKP